jgi:hypothetical protein
VGARQDGAKHGIAVSPERMAHAKKYVARKIVQAERRGAKNIDARAREFAGVYVDEVRVRYDTAYGKSHHPRAKNIHPRADALVNALVWEYGAYSAVVMNGLEQVGRYSIDPTGRPDATGAYSAAHGNSLAVTWKPKGARKPERVGVASSWRKATRIVETDHRYHFPR